MAHVSTYLNFQGRTEEALTAYAEVFGTQIASLTRFGDMPAGGPGELPADEKDLVMHAVLPIAGGHL
ncbi:MAG: VOC family protein, partial [Nocardioidaceae bacterium]